MTPPSSFLVRCAYCQHNFETRTFGQITCPICRSQIHLEPPEGFVEPQEEEAAPESFPEEGPAISEDTPELRATESPRLPEDPPPVGPPEEHEPGLDDLRKLLELRKNFQAQPAPSFQPAWESEDGGRLHRFGETLKQIFANPTWFFANLRINGVKRALSFAWIVCTIAVAFFAVYGLWQLSRNEQALLQAPVEPGGGDPAEMVETLRSSLLVSLFGAPIFGLINVLLSTLLYHLGVRLAGNRNEGIRATFRATAYGFAPMVLVAVPFIGHLIGGLWSIVLQIIGLAEVHRIGPARASLAVLLPVTGIMLLLYQLL